MPPSAPPLWETFSLSRPSLEKSLSFVTRTWLFVFHTRPPSALAAGGGSFFACASRGERREYLENDTIAISPSGEQASCLYPVWDIGRTLLLSGWKMCTVLRKGGKNRRLFLIPKVLFTPLSTQRVYRAPTRRATISSRYPMGTKHSNPSTIYLSLKNIFLNAVVPADTRPFMKQPQNCSSLLKANKYAFPEKTGCVGGPLVVRC